MKHMQSLRKRILLTAAALVFAAPLAHAQLGSTTGTTTINVTVGAEAGLTVGGTTNLSSVGTNFANYTGTTNLTYYVRTTQTTGTGSITLKVTSDFNCAAGGPCVATPPTSGDALSYTCTVTSPGTACGGSQTSLTTASTPFSTFGADAHSNPSGNSASASWSLTNDSKYKTGAYSATVTFTISAT